MNILLIRHCEAAKNISSSFTGDDLSDGLTDRGRREAADLVESIPVIEGRCNLQFERIISSTAGRALQTATALARGLARELVLQSGLESIGSGVLAGRSEREAWQEHPEYMRALTLYRAGVFNSYDIPRFEGKEGKLDFEARVWEAFRRSILSISRDAIIVAGRSTITALLISVARRARHYPGDFFGHVPLDLAGISWVIYSDTRYEIVNVNISAHDLATGDLEDVMLRKARGDRAI